MSQTTDSNHDFIFQSTRPARGATGNKPYTRIRRRISIHAPREGRDTPMLLPALQVFYFNPRAPRGARLSITIVKTPTN